LQGREIVVLLYAFPEKSKSTKNNPKSYSYAIEKAKERIEELKLSTTFLIFLRFQDFDFPL